MHRCVRDVREASARHPPCEVGQGETGSSKRGRCQDPLMHLALLLVWPCERSVPFYDYERAGFIVSPDALGLHLDS